MGSAAGLRGRCGESGNWTNLHGRQSQVLRRIRAYLEEQAMMISQKLNAAINEEVGMEFFASNQYVAIAAYFEAKGLKGLAEMFYKQGDEERSHAMKFIRYVVLTGGTVQIPDVKAPQVGIRQCRGGGEAGAGLGVGCHQALQRPDDPGHR
jgi:hypothetical protein